MSTPAYATRFAGGWSQYTNGWTDSLQSATPIAATGVSAFVTGTAMEIVLPANNANGTPTGTPGGTASAPSGNYQRCEIYPNTAGLGCVAADGDIHAGATGYFGLSILLGSSFPTTTSTWQVITQWKNDGSGSPPFELKIGNGYLYLDGNSGGWSHNVCPISPGGQYNIVIGATFTESASTSYMNAWVNGTQYVNNAQPVGQGLLYPGIGDYWKVGIYRDSAIQPGATIWYGAIAHDVAYQPVADYIAATTVAPPPPTTPATPTTPAAAPGQTDNTPLDLFATVQQMIAGLNPDQGRHAMLIEAMHLCADELAVQGISAPTSVGSRMRGDLAKVQAAAAAAAAVGEPGSYVATHDARVYSPQQMVVQLHRMLVALGWTTSSASPPPATVPVGATAPIFPPPTWRAALDQGGLAGSHTALGSANRVPATLPNGQVINVAKARLPGGRQGFAYAANLPAGATRVIAQPGIPAPTEGQESWFGFSVLLSRNFPVDDGRFHAIAYWRNVEDQNCPVMLITSGGKLCLAGYAGSASFVWLYNQPICDIDVLNWHDVLLRVKFSKTPGTGTVDVYVDGSPSLIGYAPPTGTLTPTGSTVMTANLRYGFYRDNSAPYEACAYHMNWAMGSSFGSVMLPAAG